VSRESSDHIRIAEKPIRVAMEDDMRGHRLNGVRMPKQYVCGASRHWLL
jgi:hypothetical protein